jgi:hypothetical protein
LQSWRSPWLFVQTWVGALHIFNRSGCLCTLGGCRPRHHQYGTARVIDKRPPIRHCLLPCQISAPCRGDGLWCYMLCYCRLGFVMTCNGPKVCNRPSDTAVTECWIILVRVLWVCLVTYRKLQETQQQSTSCHRMTAHALSRHRVHVYDAELKQWITSTQGRTAPTADNACKQYKGRHFSITDF